MFTERGTPVPRSPSLPRSLGFLRSPGFSRSPLCALSLVLVLRACGGTVPIQTLLDDPPRYDGKTVRIAGEVKGSMGALGYGAYRVSDGTGTLPVVSEGGGAPRDGTRIGVEGTFRSAFTLGTETAAVLVEKRRYIP
ncbi:MAG TPA: hypothetical protein VIQ98_06270 [Gemmatimonadales bacterium]